MDYLYSLLGYSTEQPKETQQTTSTLRIKLLDRDGNFVGFIEGDAKFLLTSQSIELYNENYHLKTKLEEQNKEIKKLQKEIIRLQDQEVNHFSD